LDQTIEVMVMLKEIKENITNGVMLGMMIAMIPVAIVCDKCGWLDDLDYIGGDY